MRPEPCEVQGYGPESNVVQGCHAPHVVHGRVQNIDQRRKETAFETRSAPSGLRKKTMGREVLDYQIAPTLQENILKIVDKMVNC